MTFQPPPPPPPPPGGEQPNQPYSAPAPPPPAAPQPPAGQWSAPPPSPGHSASAASFDPKLVNQLDWGILAAGVLAFIFSFVSYYSYTVKASAAGVTLGSATGHVSAWHGFFGWFGMLCALVGSGLVALALFAPQVKLPFPHRLAGLGGYALATLCLILAIFIVPGDTGGASAFGVSIDKGHGFGFWISLIVIIAGLVLSLMRFQQTGGKLPGALEGKIPNIGGYGPGGSGSQPPSGYGPPQ